MRILIAIIMMMGMSAGAAVYRVSPTNDVQGVVAKLVAGDKLIFSAGKYRDGIILEGVKGSADKYIRVRGERGAIIVPRLQDGILVSNSEYIKIEGFEISGARRAGVIVFKSKYIEVSGCTLKEHGKWGLQTCLSDYVSVTDCDILGSKIEHGIYFSTTDHPVVKNCRIYDNNCCGIHFNGDKNEGGDGVISDGVVSDNIIYGNGAVGGAAINMDSAERMIISNNKIYGNKAGGITSFCEDGAKAGAGNQFLSNSVKFDKGQGRYALQLFNGSTNSLLRGNVLQCGRGPALEIDKVSLPGLICESNTYEVVGKEKTVLIEDKWFSVKYFKKGLPTNVTN